MFQLSPTILSTPTPTPAPTPAPAPDNGAVTPRDAQTADLAPVAEDHAQPIPNPTLRLDAGLGMVVLEFRDGSGGVKNSIPSERMLAAYRNHAEPVPGPPAKPAPTTDQPEPNKRFA